MMQAVAIGGNGIVYSIQRAKGISHVVEHTATAARSIYQAKDNMRALWASPTGVVHAAGKHHHTNLGGAWRTTKHGGGDMLSMWGAADDDVFAGSLDGAIMRWSGGAWTMLDEHTDMITGIHGTSAANVMIVGEDFAARFDGTTLTKQKPPSPLVQGVYCVGSDTWFCGYDTLYRNDEAVASLAKGDSGELYGLAIGSAGVFALGPASVLEVKGSTLVEVGGLDAHTSAKGANYSTAIAGNGTRVVAGAARTVLVNDGNGFVAWPTIDPKSVAAPAKKPATKKRTKRA